MITNQGKKVLNASKLYTTGSSFSAISIRDTSFSFEDTSGTTRTGAFGIYAVNGPFSNNFTACFEALEKYKLTGFFSPNGPTIGIGSGASSAYIYVNIGYRSSVPDETVTSVAPTVYNDIVTVAFNDGKIYITVANTYGIEVTINEIDIVFALTSIVGGSASTGYPYLHAVYHFNDIVIQPGETYAFKLEYPLT